MTAALNRNRIINVCIEIMDSGVRCRNKLNLEQNSVAISSSRKNNILTKVYEKKNIRTLTNAPRQ